MKILFFIIKHLKIFANFKHFFIISFEILSFIITTHFYYIFFLPHLNFVVIFINYFSDFIIDEIIIIIVTNFFKLINYLLKNYSFIFEYYYYC